MVLTFEIQKISPMKDYANSRLKLKQTVIWAFVYISWWYLKVKVGLLKAKTLFSEGKDFFAFFSDQEMFDPWSTAPAKSAEDLFVSTRLKKETMAWIQTCLSL